MVRILNQFYLLKIEFVGEGEVPLVSSKIGKRSDHGTKKKRSAFKYHISIYMIKANDLSELEAFVLLCILR